MTRLEEIKNQFFETSDDQDLWVRIEKHYVSLETAGIAVENLHLQDLKELAETDTVEAPADNRVTTRQIAEFAQNAAYDLAFLTGTSATWTNFTEYNEEQKAKKDGEVLAIINEASSQNHFSIMQKNHDTTVTDMLKAGWTYGEHIDEFAKKHPLCLPFSELPNSVKSRATFYRNCVLTLLPLWKGY